MKDRTIAGMIQKLNLCRFVSGSNSFELEVGFEFVHSVYGL